jgi:predicted small metal-binding protein
MAELPKDRRRHVRLIFTGKKRKPYERPKKEVISMAAALKQVECDPKCGFLIRSHDEKEVIEIAKEHAKKSHNMTITEKEIRAMMKNA